ncbi:helix-turn-helix transcriptional regulator [Aneurinibacillus sp. UBA3580]|jgi:DNA-binding XRE family transcriptional regulator|uniref:helix-turn-helix transcriptional regulator n=1 Tax=Aneurinibacillus sp. UBA3580 TaxID=1946041 RepID=UPI00257E7484|nr:helix-turn-helix transcriptional regulator [Aneurinibacillus sp. UBA3580]
MSHAEIMRAIRYHKNMTQQELADAIGVSVSSVKRIETGSMLMTPHIHWKLFTMFPLTQEILSAIESVRQAQSFLADM